MNALLQQVDTLLLALFSVSALVGAVLMLVLRQPMRVALALISTMIFLGGIYGLLGVHFIAAFQVLVYVGAVMLFMVYVIMLLDLRHTARARGISPRAVLAIVLGLVFVAVLTLALAGVRPPAMTAGGGFTLHQFAAQFLQTYWLHFELTSVLLLAAVIGALAVIKGPRRG